MARADEDNQPKGDCGGPPSFEDDRANVSPQPIGWFPFLKMYTFVISALNFPTVQLSVNTKRFHLRKFITAKCSIFKILFMMQEEGRGQFRFFLSLLQS